MKNLKTLGAKAALAGSSAMFALTSAMVNPAAALTALAANTGSNTFSNVTDPIISLINQVTLILIPLVGAVGAVYCILLGVKYAKAEEPQEREKAKSHLKNAIIGYMLIFILIVALNRLTPVMTQWMATSNSTK